MTDAELLLLIGGIFHFAMVIFHLLFTRIFRWDQALPALDFINRQLMPVMNLCLTFGFLEVGYLSFAYADELLSTALGHVVLVAIALFWLWRAILQILFFRLRHWVSWGFLGLFLGAAALYAYVGLQPIRL